METLGIIVKKAEISTKRCHRNDHIRVLSNFLSTADSPTSAEVDARADYDDTWV